MKRETKTVIEIEGMGMLGVLLDEHDDITYRLRINVSKIENLLREINCKINQSPDGTDD